MGLFFVILGFVAIGAGWLWHLRIQGRWRRAETWPTTGGTVLSAEVVSMQMGGGTVHSPQVTYSYDAGGQAMEGTGLQLGAPPMFNRPAKAKALADRYPSGSQVTVHYDPALPAVAALTLKVGEGYGPLMAYSLGATFVVLGSLSAFMGT
jgi:hypothetical protein